MAADCSKDFQDSNGELDSLLASAQNAAMLYFMMSHPGQKVYSDMADKADAYALALVEKHGSIGAFLETQKQAIDKMTAPKGVKADLQTDEKQIASLDATLKRDGRLGFETEAFMELFVLKLPSTLLQVAKRMAALPDKPAPEKTPCPGQ